MARPIRTLKLTTEQRADLEALVRKSTSEQRMVMRTKIVLLRADGCSQDATARALNVRRSVVGKWEKRFRQKAISGLAEARRTGRPQRLNTKVIKEIIDEATRPPKGRPRWSVRSMGEPKASPKPPSSAFGRATTSSRI
jgi:transposase